MSDFGMLISPRYTNINVRRGSSKVGTGMATTMQLETPQDKKPDTFIDQSCQTSLHAVLRIELTVLLGKSFRKKEGSAAY